VKKFVAYKGVPVKNQRRYKGKILVTLHQTERDGKNTKLLVTEDEWRRFSSNENFSDDTRRCVAVKTSCVGRKGVRDGKLQTRSAAVPR